MSSGNHYRPDPQGDPGGRQQGWQQPGHHGPDSAPPRPDHSPSAGWGQPGGHDQSGGYGQPGYGQEPYSGTSAPAYSAAGPALVAAGQAPQPAPAPGYAGQDLRPRKKKKSKTSLILPPVVVGVVVLLVVVGAIVLNTVNRDQYGPDNVAAEYLAALEAGDYAAANEIAAPTVPNGASEELLDPKYVQNSSETITGASVDDTTIEGDTATINTSYTLGGQPYELTLNAQRDGRQGLFFDNWVLGSPTLQTITVELPRIDGVTVNGQAFAPAGGRTEYAVLPGNYQVTTAESTYFESSDDQITVGFSETEQPQPAGLNVAVEPTDAYREDVQTAVEDQLDECAENTSIMNEGCPFNADATDPTRDLRVSEDGVEDTVDYTILAQPEVEASMSADLSAGSFYTAEPGRYEFRLDSETGGEGAWEGNGNLMPTGSVHLDGDALTVEFF